MVEKQGCRRTGYAVDADGQENRVCSRCGWAGEPVIQEEWIAAAAGGLYFKL